MVLRRMQGESEEGQVCGWKIGSSGDLRALTYMAWLSDTIITIPIGTNGASSGAVEMMR